MSIFLNILLLFPINNEVSKILLDTSSFDEIGLFVTIKLTLYHNLWLRSDVCHWYRVIWCSVSSEKHIFAQRYDHNTLKYVKNSLNSSLQSNCRCNQCNMFFDKKCLCSSTWEKLKDK